MKNLFRGSSDASRSSLRFSQGKYKNGSEGRLKAVRALIVLRSKIKQDEIQFTSLAQQSRIGAGKPFLEG